MAGILLSGMLAARLPLLQQFAKFALVAGAGIILHLLIITGLVEGVGAHYVVAFVVALPFTLSLKFALNKIWTFR